MVVGFFISGFRLRRVVGPFFFAPLRRGLFFAGIRGVLFFAGIRAAASLGGFLSLASAMRLRGADLFRGHPRCAYAARALPLCGAAPTFLCSGKEK